AVRHLDSFPTRRSSDLFRAWPRLFVETRVNCIGRDTDGHERDGSARFLPEIRKTNQLQVYHITDTPPAVSTDRGVFSVTKGWGRDRKSTRLNSSHSQIS